LKTEVGGQRSAGCAIGGVCAISGEIGDGMTEAGRRNGHNGLLLVTDWLSRYARGADARKKRYR